MEKGIKEKELNGFPAQSPALSDYHVENINLRVVYKSIWSPFHVPSHYTEDQKIQYLVCKTFQNLKLHL